MSAAAEHLAAELDRGIKEKLSVTQVLEQLLGIEVAATRERRQRGRLRFARYPVHKTLAEFDLDFQPGIDRKVVAELSTLRFVEEKRNVILLGPPGVGKSHLAIALGIAATDAGYRTYFTAAAGATLEIEADHRRHAEIENTIRDVKYGMALNHMSSGRFAANAAWLGFNVIAHNLARWVTRLGLKETLLTTKTVRTRFIALPGRLARTGRRLHLHLPANWPWQEAFLAARENLASLIIPTATPA
jgi:hypothetical protein